MKNNKRAGFALIASVPLFELVGSAPWTILVGSTRRGSGSFDVFN